MSMKRLNFRGHQLNWRTVDMLEVAERKWGHRLRVIQGSYNHGGVSQSAGTHDGGGAADVWPSTGVYVDSLVTALRRVGFAAWHRTTAQGPWISHIHCIALEDAEASSGAKVQMREYRDGQNGLANHARDDGVRVKIVNWEQYCKTHPQALYVSLYYAKKELSTGGKHSYLGIVRIQRCLNDKLGTTLVCDGHAGEKTKTAYKAWQKKLGYKEKGRTGIPSYYSLRKLLAGRYRTSVV